MYCVLRVSLIVLGVLCLVFGLFPPVLYGIVNVGVVGLLLLGGSMISLPLFWHRLIEYPGLRRLLTVGGCVVLVFLLAVSAAMARRAWFCPPPDSGPITVIVLGGKILGDQPSLMLWRRLQVAGEYLEKNPQAMCIVSGGQGADEDYTEAYVMRKHLLEAGIAPDRVLEEGRSTNTRQNLRYSRAMMTTGELAVISTDSFHQLRASIFGSAEGLKTYNLSSLTPWGLMPSYWLREIFAVSWAFVSIRLGIA